MLKLSGAIAQTNRMARGLYLRDATRDLANGGLFSDEGVRAHEGGNGVFTLRATVKQQSTAERLREDLLALESPVIARVVIEQKGAHIRTRYVVITFVPRPEA